MTDNERNREQSQFDLLGNQVEAKTDLPTDGSAIFVNKGHSLQVKESIADPRFYDEVRMKEVFELYKGKLSETPFLVFETTSLQEYLNKIQTESLHVDESQTLEQRKADALVRLAEFRMVANATSNELRTMAGALGNAEFAIQAYLRKGNFESEVFATYNVFLQNWKAIEGLKKAYDQLGLTSKIEATNWEDLSLRIENPDLEAKLSELPEDKQKAAREAEEEEVKKDLQTILNLLDDVRQEAANFTSLAGKFLSDAKAIQARIAPLLVKAFPNHPMPTVPENT